MNHFAYKLVHQHALRASILAFVLAFSIGICATAATEQYTQSLNKERARQIAEIQAGKIQHVIEALLFTSQTAKVLLTEGGGEIKHFEQSMADILSGYNLRNIALAPDGIVSRIYPLAGNEKAIGHNLLTDPKRATEAIAARESRTLSLAGPYKLLQGGYGALGRLPIYLKDEEGREYFWGFICVTLELPEALEAAQMQKLEEQGYSYELWKVEPDTKEKQIITRSVTDISCEPQSVPISLPNSVWHLDISPAAGWYSVHFLFVKLILSALFALLIALLAKMVIALIRSKNDLNDSLIQQASNYQKLDLLNDELRMFRHDVKNHYISLFSLLECGDLPEAKEYLSNMAELVATSSQIINTENYVFDALLAKKIAMAKEKQIQVESEVFINKQLRIENKDWSSLFGNALDNAIEACMHIPPQSRKICIFIQYRGNILQAKITNSMMPGLDKSNNFFRTTKGDPLNHGLGMKNMQSIVQKYHGVLETSFDGELFILSFLLFNV